MAKVHSDICLGVLVAGFVLMDSLLMARPRLAVLEAGVGVALTAVGTYGWNRID
jgi:hypothetical protein